MKDDLILSTVPFYDKAIEDIYAKIRDMNILSIDFVAVKDAVLSRYSEGDILWAATETERRIRRDTTIGRTVFMRLLKEQRVD